MTDGPLLKKYEEEVARIEALKVTLKVEEARLKWLVVAGLVAGIALAVATKKPLYGCLPFALGLVMFGTGLYLTRVHTMERDYNLVRAKQEVARLKARLKVADSPGAATGVSATEDTTPGESATGARTPET